MEIDGGTLFLPTNDALLGFLAARNITDLEAALEDQVTRGAVRDVLLAHSVSSATVTLGRNVNRNIVVSCGRLVVGFMLY